MTQGRSIRQLTRWIALMSIVAMTATGCRGCMNTPLYQRLFGGGQDTAAPLNPGTGIESSALPDPIRGETPTEVSDLRRTFFEFDSVSLLEPAKRELDANAQWIRSRPGVHIQIEGHCDERGTADYNYALGQRRADVCRTYLISKGVEASRLHTISYGSERPAETGSNDSAYAHNRRCQYLVYKAR